MHLLVSLSPHGYGHAAMTAQVINRLRQLLPGLRLTLQTTTPRAWLESRYAGEFGLIGDTPDFGLRMYSAVSVDAEASAEAYRHLHAGLDGVVAAEARRMTALGVDLVLANVPYVALLAAKRAGIPSLALCCLNWADLYQEYCGDRPEADAILARMLDGYHCAEEFLCPEPTMPMPSLANRRAIGPLARRGTRRRAELLARLGLEEGAKIGLIAFGGMDINLSFALWPRLEGWTWISGAGNNDNPDFIDRSAVPLDFTDLLCSVDVVVGKPGYGTYTEAAVNGTPMLSLPRPGWPECPGLEDWLSEHGRCLSITVENLFDGGALKAQLQKLFLLPIKPLVEPTGIEEAAQTMLGLLARCARSYTH